VTLGKKANEVKRSKTKGSKQGGQKDSDMEDSGNEEEKDLLVQDDEQGVHKKKIKKNVESKDAWT